MKIILNKPYVYFVILIFLVYVSLNVILSGFYNTIPLILVYAKTLNWFKLGISLFLTLLIGLLIAFNSVLIYAKYKERRKCKKKITLSSAGAIGGLITGVCPLCVTGLIPLILGLAGISFSLASLPFQGIEVQVLVVIILLVSLINLSKR
ncbi:hypothetical protein J4233_02890 [Candidatus Pacearchaeota archaeon]|nr:MAG: hypothetical protein UT44_C0043G0007 [Candidatus Levybacteria bacterium GW2011_GWA1_39_32]MBS3077194.1 hypothetical protein [Candidatus Pacearchaeota archaeon]